MSELVTILVATMSGTTEMVAEEVAGHIEDAGGSAKILRMEKASVATLATAKGPILICSSTYGTGEVPDNGQALYAALEAERPALSGLRYGVIALGDSIYPQTFCFGGKRFDTLLASLGARLIGDRFEYDSRSGVYPEEAASEWAGQWFKSLDA